jgi:hypothetical protein
VRKWLIAGAGIILLLLAAVLFSAAPRRPAQAALAQFEAELRSRGERLTFEELEPAPASDSVVDLRPFLETAEQLESAGLADLSFMDYAAPGAAYVSWQSAEPRTYSAAAVTGVTWARLIEQLEATKDLTDQLRDHVRNPDLRRGRRLDPFGRITDELIMKRQAARWFAGTVAVELHRGRPDHAMDNLTSLLDLCQMQRDEFAILTQMMRIALTRLALAVTWEVLQTNGWNQTQLADLQRSWSEFDALQALERGRLGERALLLEFMTGIAHSARDDGGLWNRLLASWYPPERDALFYLKHLQPLLDGIRNVSNGTATSGLEPELADLEVALDRAGSSLFRHRYTVGLISLGNVKRAVDAAMIAETQRRMTLVAIALQRFSLSHGAPPPSLAELVPDFLGVIPLDPFDGWPLRYRLDPDGSFVLYSIGPDRVDDGGDPAPTTLNADPGLGEAQDIVWPSPKERNQHH